MATCTDMGLFGGENDWSELSGYVPLIVAEHRLRNLRRLSARLLAVHEDLMTELHQERSEYLAWVATDPDAAVYINESGDAAEEAVGMAQDEPAVLLLGSLVAYGFSLLESALRECAETAAAIRRAAPSRDVRPPKIEGWLNVLGEDLGVEVAWDPVSSGISRWRRARNSYIHELDIGAVPGLSDGSIGGSEGLTRIKEFLGLIEEAVAHLDEAMAKV